MNVICDLSLTFSQEDEWTQYKKEPDFHLQIQIRSLKSLKTENFNLFLEHTLKLDATTNTTHPHSDIHLIYLN